MELSVKELAEYAEHVRKTERNGKVTVTNNHNEDTIRDLRAEVYSLTMVNTAAERDLGLRDATITELRHALQTWHGPEAWADLQYELERKATRIEELSRELELARDFNATCNPGPEAPVDRTASAFRSAVIEREANGARDPITAAMDVYILWGLDRLAAYESAVRPVGQARS